MLLGRCFPSIAPIQLGRVPLLKEPLCCFLWSLNLCAVCPEQTTDGKTRKDYSHNTRAKALCSELYSFETKTKWHDCTIMIHIWYSHTSFTGVHALLFAHSIFFLFGGLDFGQQQKLHRSLGTFSLDDDPTHRHSPHRQTHMLGEFAFMSH